MCVKCKRTELFKPITNQQRIECCRVIAWSLDLMVDVRFNFGLIWNNVSISNVYLSSFTTIGLKFYYQSLSIHKNIMQTVDSFVACRNYGSN